MNFLLTSNEHYKYRESFFHVSVRSNVAEADARQGGASKVKGGDVARSRWKTKII